MQALSRRHLDPACEKSFCVVEEKSLLPLNQNREYASSGTHLKSPISKGTDDARKSSLLKESALVRESNTANSETFRGETLSKTAIPSFELTRGERLFPDFFPRDKLLRYHQDRVIPPDVQADPVLGSWMHLFGLQMRK